MPEERSLPPVPTGLQQLLRLASVDARFRGELIARRGELARAAGLELTTSERAILAATPVAQIATMVDSLAPPDPARRDFLRQSARAAVLVLGGAGLAVGGEACRRPSHNESLRVAGATPDPPPAGPDAASPGSPGKPPPGTGIEGEGTSPKPSPRPDAAARPKRPVRRPRTKGMDDEMPPLKGKAPEGEMKNPFDD